MISEGDGRGKGSTLVVGARLGPAGGGRDARIWEKNRLLGMPSSDEGRLALLMAVTAVAAARTRVPSTTHTHTHSAFFANNVE